MQNSFAQVDQLKSDVAHWKAETERLQSAASHASEAFHTVEELEAKCSVLDTSLTQAEAEKQSMQQLWNEIKTQLESQLQMLQAKLLSKDEEARGELLELSRDLATADEEANGLKKKNIQLLQKIDILNETITSLEQERVEAEAKFNHGSVCPDLH